MNSHTSRAMPSDANIRRLLRDLYRRKSAVEHLIQSLEAYQRTFGSEDGGTTRVA